MVYGYAGNKTTLTPIQIPLSLCVRTSFARIFITVDRPFRSLISVISARSSIKAEIGTFDSAQWTARICRSVGDSENVNDSVGYDNQKILTVV